MTAPQFPLMGLLGGTFDPVHHGHISMAEHCFKLYSMHSMHFLPNQNHHHKPGVKTSATHRKQMLQLAIAEHTHWHINTLELKQPGPAYTRDTVKALHALYPKHALCFILSVETFNNFNTWHDYTHILDDCHLLIIGRSEHALQFSPWQQQLLSRHSTEDPHVLTQHQQGKILLDPHTPPAITSTAIRAAFSDATQSCTGVSPAVKDYIHTHDLYR